MAETFAPPLVDVTIVVPIFNERENVERCSKSITDALAASPYSYEILFVDDGSTDGSTEIMRALYDSDPRVQLIRMARNGGQQRALAVGLRHARGRAIVTYDGDLQYDPKCLVDFTAAILGGAELASGNRVPRRDGFMTRFLSAAGNALINRALGIHQRDFGSVKGYSRELAHAILERDHQLLCIPAMGWVLAESAAEIDVVHKPRAHGVSKWSAVKRVQVFLDVIATYGRRPFHWLLLLGLACLLPGLLLGAALVAVRVAQPDRVISGTLIFFGMFLVFSGVNFGVLAYVGEFVVRGYRESVTYRSGRVKEVRQHPIETVLR